MVPGQELSVVPEQNGSMVPRQVHELSVVPRQIGSMVPAQELSVVPEQNGSVVPGQESSVVPDQHYNTDVSVIIPVHNAVPWLDETFSSICKQDFSGSMEVSVYDDNSDDGSLVKINEWKQRFHDNSINLVLTCASDRTQRGAGYARNRAIEHSTGQFLCFIDADDVMFPSRISSQYQIASANPNALVGSQFIRLPADSTDRYTRWANSLTSDQLYHQIYTSHSPTVILPTWFCSRTLFERIGGFAELTTTTPEDLIFVYKLLEAGGEILRVDSTLMLYRYHPSATSFSISEASIWDVRVRALERNVLRHWTSFTVWNAGKQGKRFYRSLTDENRRKVVAFCDVDTRKILRGVYVYEQSRQQPKPTVPIVDYRAAQKPFILCVKLDLTGGQFEANLASLNLVEGIDYFHFS